MAIIDWKSSLNVGIEKIDDEHRRMIGLIRDFNAAVEAGKAAGVLAELLENLMNYAQIHFATEEALLRRCQCPDLERQEAQHEDFVLRVYEFKEKLEVGKRNLYQELVEFLASWWTNHIEVEDKNYVEFVKRSGLG